MPLSLVMKDDVILTTLSVSLCVSIAALWMAKRMLNMDDDNVINVESWLCLMTIDMNMCAFTLYAHSALH